MVTGETVADKVGRSSQIAGHIRSAIQAGEYAPGSRLVERKLAEKFGVSHIPVREALSTLAEEGLVERLPRRGARVAALTGRDLEEVSSLRTILEQFVIVRAQEHMTPERERQLRDIVEAMTRDAASGDVDKVLERDQEFHELLWQFADHRLLLSVSTQLRNRIGGFLAAANRALSPDERIIHAETHAGLVDAMMSGDPARASDAMTEHIAAAQERIAQTFQLE